MASTSAYAVDIPTIFGRVLAALRDEQGDSKTSFARRLKWDRNVLMRLESGQSAVTIGDLIRLERTLKKAGQPIDVGDLTALTARVANVLWNRDVRVSYGWGRRSRMREDEAPLETAALDRVVAVVLDKWFEKEGWVDGPYDDDWG